jgi:endonuclease YncB( thermonuclease family)
VRWSVVGADRDRPGRYVAVVEFPGYAEAMANSGHPATAAFAKELQSISASEPEFRNLDVYGVAS